MTQPDPSDRLTPAARNKPNRLDVPKPTTEAGRMLLRDVVDHSEHYHATSDLPMAGHVPSMILAIEQEARALGAAQTAAAVEALRKAHEKVCDCDFNDCDLSDTIRDLDAAAKQHDEAGVTEADAAEAVVCLGYCGILNWTLSQYGAITHKHSCPRRTTSFCQTHRDGCPDTVDAFIHDELPVLLLQALVTWDTSMDSRAEAIAARVQALRSERESE